MPGTASGETMPSRSWSIGLTPVVSPVPVPEVTCPLASEPDVWLLGMRTLELALSAVVVSTVAVLLLVPLDEGGVPVAAIDVVAATLACGALIGVGREVLLVAVAVEGLVVAVAVLPFVPETVAVLPFVPEAEVAAVVTAAAGKASASAESRGSA